MWQAIASMASAANSGPDPQAPGVYVGGLNMGTPFWLQGQGATPANAQTFRAAGFSVPGDNSALILIAAVAVAGFVLLRKKGR